MYTCEKCQSEKPCPACDYEAERVVLPCDLPSALWVRVSQTGGPKLDRVQVSVQGEKARLTAVNGFAVFDPVPAKGHTVALDLESGGHHKRYKAVEPKLQSVGSGQVGLVTFELDPLANARVDPQDVLLFVKGKAKELTLSTDEPSYRGAGTVTGIDPAKLVEVPEAQQVGAKISLRAKDQPTTWGGLELTWKLDEVPGATAKTKVRIVQATLEPCQPLEDQPLERGKRGDPGLVVAAKTAANDKPTRAKVRLSVSPREFDGTLQIEAKAKKVKLYAKADGTDEITEIKGPFTEEKAFFVEGATVSDKKFDEEVRLVVDGEVLDRFVATVVATELVIHEDVVPASKPQDQDEYKPIPGKVRILFPDPRHKLVRAKLLVKKTPWDAPCLVQLSVEGGGAIKVLRDKLPSERSLQRYDASEKAVALPSQHKVNAGFAQPTEDFVDDKGVPLWVEGTSPGEVKLSVGIGAVQEKTDTLTLTVRKPKLQIHVTRKFVVPVTPGEIQLDFFDMKDGASINTGFPKLGAGDAFKEAEVDVDDYRLKLLPQAVGEQFARILRTEPAGDAAAISVTKDTVVKFELAPYYTKVQFIAYWIFTGQSKGIDVKKVTHDDRVTTARADMKAKAALMKAAIEKITAFRGADIEGSDTLKIFMAPEFTFRGAQGAYPIDVVSEIFDELVPEIDKGIYDDWLFVPGTAIGTVTSPNEVTAANKLSLATTRHVEVIATPPRQPGGPPVNIRREYRLTYQGGTRPSKGWAMLEPHVGTVVSVGTSPLPRGDWVVVDHLDEVTQPAGPLVGAAKFVDPPEVEIANVALVRKGGTKIPCGADGRGLRQLLVNKEYVAWGDLPTNVDRNQESFFLEGRQLVELYGMVCRAKAPMDSAMRSTFQGNWKWGPDPPDKSEDNVSGLGGGTLFWLDWIQFGLEICMDHQFGRLANGVAKKGLTPPNVQLVTSGGAEIKDYAVCTVNQGLVFNVDMSHHQAQKGGVDLNTRGLPLSLLNKASDHYDITRESDRNPGEQVGNGKVFIYEPADIAY